MNTQLDTNESWEQRETQIKLERAEDFAKMSPEEQIKQLQEEKLKFTREQAEARQKLGYQKYDPKASAEAKKQTTTAEEQSKKTELAKFEQSLDKKTSNDGNKTLEKDSVGQKRFQELYQAAVHNIESQKPFQFQSLAFDDHGRLVSHLARMTKLSDYSQKDSLTPSQISERLANKQTRPERISLTVEIDMGEDKDNHLGLMNLSLEVPLASFQEGHFTDKIAKFTNIVLFAATMHKKQQEIVSAKSLDKKHIQAEQQKLDNLKQQSGLKTLRQDGGINSNPSLEQGDLSTVTFSCNNGSIWGTFDQHGLPANPKELQEAVDKISIEK